LRDPAAAEQAFRESIAVAKRQGGRASEVMVASSPAKFIVAAHRTAEAQEVLSRALHGLQTVPSFPAVAEAQALLASCQN